MAAADDDESVLDISEQTNRPLDVALFQQRVKAWSPILDPRWVIAALLYFGVIMVPVGALAALKTAFTECFQRLVFVLQSLHLTFNLLCFL
jgi:hypothetical protein